MDAQLKGIEVPDEQALALGARKTGLDFQARGLHSPEVGLGFSGKDAGIDTPLVVLDEIEVGHSHLLLVQRASEK